jgi:hypothetical protein
MAISTGQITIVDYNDAVSLTGFISANLALTQTFNPDNATYAPNFATTNMVLTPSLFKSGSGVDLITDSVEKSNIQSIKWYDGAAEITDGATYGYPAYVQGNNRPLTIKQNVLSGSTYSKTYTVEIVYKDPYSGLNLTYKNSITINRINNGGGVTMAVCTTPNGNVYKNGGGTTLTAHCDLLRSSGVDTTNNTYQWYKYDTSQTTDVGGGVNWKKLDSSYNLGCTGYATADLTIPSSAVQGIAMFKCVITDNDSASPTYNQKFSDTVTIVDQTDPIQVVVVSSAGDVLKNGLGSSTLTAKLYRSGVEIDSGGTLYTYKWYRADKDGNADPNFGGAGINYKTGKTLTIGDADVTVKATFTVEIS